MKCLLIETKDKRKFFTHEKNFPQLIEFSKTFNAEISTVKLTEGPILELEELAPAICNPDYKKNDVKYTIVKTSTPVPKIKKRSRIEILQIADKVKKYLNEQFKNRNEVSLKELKNKFQKCELTDTALCNHIRRVKSDLEKEGFKFLKLGAGKYKVN
jgi:hypothetical protein